MYKKQNIKIISIEEMNKLLKEISKRYCFIEGKKGTKKPFSNYAYYEDSQINFSISFKKGSKVCTYRCRKDGDRKLQSIYGIDAYKICKQYIGKNGVKDLRKEKTFSSWKKLLGWDKERKCFIASAKAILYSNPKYEGQRLRAYAYDINSSYSNGMLQDMPDTNVDPKMNTRLNKNELGFYVDNGELLCTEELGKLCDFVFPRIESPFKKFIEVWYAKKKNAKNEQDKYKAKEVLNYSVGYFQKVNPFIRARIISYANKVIRDLIDENTLLCSTDSIVSLVPRNEIKIGTNIGEFKDDSKGEFFAYKGMNYQWDLDIPTYRSVSKKWFKPGWDILKDDIPVKGNLVYFNKETGLLEEA